MKLRTVKTIFQKELLDTLRDKRTLIAMLGVPIVLYPALFIFASQAAVMEQNKLDKTVSRIAVRDRSGVVEEWLKGIPMVEVKTSANPEDDLHKGGLDALVITEGDTGGFLAQVTAATIRIQFDAAETASRTAERRVSEGLEKQSERLLKERLEAYGLSPEFAKPLKVSSKNVAPPSKTAGTILGMILPVIMVVMLGIGAFYPAIDLTAGEKERGTFETLLSTPTSKFEIVCGKFLTVFALSLTTGLLNLGSMTLTFVFQLAQLRGAIGSLEVQLPPQTVLLMFLVMLPLGFFISALMMSIAVLARTFREAQNFVTPFFVVIMFPPMLASMPGVKLSAATQLIPIANAALLFKDLMTGKASLEAVFAVLVSTMLYAALALFFAAWVFQREEVILSEDRGIPLTLRRSDFTPRSAPTPAMALALFAIALVLIFYAGTYFQTREAFSGLLITQWLLILAPCVGLLWYVRVDLAQALNLRLPLPGAVLGVVLIAFAWVPLMVQLTLWQNQVLPMPEEMAQQMRKMLRLDDPGASMVLLLFVVALSPAICEEALFRGAIFSGLKQKLPAWAAVVLTGILFGILHMIVYRVFLTALSGVLLGYLVWRSRSLLSGIAAHFILNALSLLAATKRLPGALGEFVSDERIEKEGLPGGVLVGALLVFCIGVAVMETSARRTHEKG